MVRTLAASILLVSFVASAHAAPLVVSCETDSARNLAFQRSSIAAMIQQAHGHKIEAGANGDGMALMSVLSSAVSYAFEAEVEALTKTMATVSADTSSAALNRTVQLAGSEINDGENVKQALAGALFQSDSMKHLKARLSQGRADMKDVEAVRAALAHLVRQRGVAIVAFERELDTKLHVGSQEINGTTAWGAGADKTYAIASAGLMVGRDLSKSAIQYRAANCQIVEGQLPD